jgi:hypothetical protein
MRLWRCCAAIRTAAWLANLKEQNVRGKSKAKTKAEEALALAVLVPSMAVMLTGAILTRQWW